MGYGPIALPLRHEAVGCLLLSWFGGGVGVGAMLEIQEATAMKCE
jgi:hypothetical protein